MNRIACCILVAVVSFAAPAVVLPQSGTTSAAAAQTVPRDLDALTSRFFSLLSAGDVDGAFTELLKNSAIAANTEQVGNLVYQTKRTITLYGDIRGYELVSTETLGSSLIRVRYLALHSEVPVRWVLTYYKSPVKGWVVTNIKFDDHAEDMFGDE